MKNGVFLFLIGLSFAGCTSKISIKKELQLLQTIKLNIAEPSGITVFKNNLFIVSDHNGTIYRTSLEGEILKKNKTKTTDLEGITFQESSHTIWLISENKRQLIELDLSGNIIQKIKVKGNQQHKNSGLEGVCFVENEKMFYVVNERAPKQILGLNLTGQITTKFKVDFCKDISGICFDKTTNSFWIVSDESKSMYQISKTGKLLKKFKLPITEAEGIVIYKNSIYIVSDSENKLYVFKKLN